MGPATPARGSRGPGAWRIHAAAGAATLLYLLAWFAFAQDGDAAAIWGAPQGLRSLLCVAPGPRLTLAAAPTEADHAAVQATLLTTEERRGPPGLQVVHRDEGYRASVAIGGHERPCCTGPAIPPRPGDGRSRQPVGPGSS